ncbi:transposase [Streptomyces sp. HMX87]|uniref:transposase n=1 Tax=Streptomyces sp. HMX87 TaxID=3390849 RepID=UPI003A8AAF19
MRSRRPGRSTRSPRKARPAATSGYDGGKKIKGRKRHIVVDTLGLTLAVMVTPASTGDRHAAQDLLCQAARRHHRLGACGRTADTPACWWAGARPP